MNDMCPRAGSASGADITNYCEMSIFRYVPQLCLSHLFPVRIITYVLRVELSMYMFSTLQGKSGTVRNR